MRFHGLSAFSDHLIMFLSVTGERMCTEYLSTAWEQGAKKNLLCFFTVQEKQAIIKVTGNDDHALVWLAVASYLWMNVHPYLVDFYSNWPRNSVVMITDAFLIYINCLKVVIII